MDAAIKNWKNTQPFLVCVTEEPSQHATGELYLVIDGNHMKMQGNSVLRALDILYKTYHIFQLDYPADFAAMFNFLDVYVYKWRRGKTTGPVNNFFRSL
jgi:hypothetical protein